MDRDVNCMSGKCRFANKIKKAVIEATKPRFHIVKVGESLWDLALEFYGDGLKFDLIYRANKVIIKDQSWIYPGQKLQIPEKP